MNKRKRIEDLERRVRELEARPVMPAVIVVPQQPVPQAYPWHGITIPPFWVDPFPTITWTVSDTVTSLAQYPTTTEVFS